MSKIPYCSYCIPSGGKCGAIGKYSFPCKDRGGRNIYFCEEHNPANLFYNLESYSTENKNYVGTANNDKITSSLELETSFTTTLARVELLNASFIPTQDSTVNIEFKSPIYHGLNAIAKFADSINTMIESGDIEIDENCGSHTHIGFEYGNFSFYRNKVIQHYFELFEPLDYYLTSCNYDITKLFGRGFGTWANHLDIEDAQEHRNFINVQHNYSIEFRMIKYTNAIQYRLALNWARDIFKLTIEACENDSYNNIAPKILKKTKDYLIKAQTI